MSEADEPIVVTPQVAIQFAVDRLQAAEREWYAAHFRPAGFLEG